ncbi:MAG: transketolase, partial [Lawsonibacter sp.]
MGIKSTREAAMKAILELAEQDDKIVVVSPDAVLAGRVVPFLTKFPDRVIEVGIAEQDAVDVAAGLATTGMKPIVISYAGFLTMRACEMIRTFIAYPGLNVKLIGLNGGMLGGEREGVTHQFYEDVGILRSMPGVKILTPADAGQVYQAAKAMMEQEGPVYLRLGSGREPEVFPEDTPFHFGK